MRYFGHRRSLQPAMPPRAALLPALAALVLVAAPAHAAPPWSPPASVADPAGRSADRPALDLGPGGTGLLGWGESPDPAQARFSRFGTIAPVTATPPAAASGSGRSLAPWELADAPVAFGRSGAAVVQRRRLDGPSGTAVGPDERLVVALGRTDGTLGPRLVLDRRARLLDTAMDGNERGDLAVAWTERVSSGFPQRDRLWLAVRRRGRAFGRPFVLVGGGVLGAVDVSVGPGGETLVAFTRRRVRGRRAGPRRVQARFRGSSRDFDPVADLGGHDGLVDLATAVAAGGRGYVAWGTQDGGEEAGRPWRVFAAVRPLGNRRRFRPTLVLDPGAGAERPVGRVVIAPGPARDATIAWSRVVVDRATRRVTYPIATATADDVGRIRERVGPGGASGVLGGGATAPDGTTTLLFTTFGPFTGSVQAVRRAPRTTRFLDPEVVGEQATSLSPPALALDPRDGRAVAAWVSGDEGRGVLTSTRPG